MERALLAHADATRKGLAHRPGGWQACWEPVGNYRKGALQPRLENFTFKKLCSRAFVGPARVGICMSMSLSVSCPSRRPALNMSSLTLLKVYGVTSVWKKGAKCPVLAAVHCTCSKTICSRFRVGCLKHASTLSPGVGPESISQLHRAIDLPLKKEASCCAWEHVYAFLLPLTSIRPS